MKKFAVVVVMLLSAVVISAQTPWLTDAERVRFEELRRSGLDAAREIARLNLPTRVLIFTMHYSKDLLRVFHDEGVRGYVLKANAAQELIQAVETLLQGDTFFHSDDAPPEARERPTFSRKPLLLRQRLEAGLRIVCALLVRIAQNSMYQGRVNSITPC